MKRAALALLLACGCDKLLGITPIPEHDAPVPPTYEVTGTYLLRQTPNDSSGAPLLVEGPYRGSDITLAVTLDDGTQPAVEYDEGAGSFRFATTKPAQAYRLDVTTPFGTTQYQMSLGHLALADQIGGRFPVVNVTKDQTLIASAISQVIGGYLFLASTGQWTQSPGVATNSSMFKYDWSIYKNTPQVGLLDASKNDRLYITGANYYYTSTVELYLALDAASPYSVTMADGGTTTISSPPIAQLSRSLCAHITGAIVAQVNRIIAADPRLSGNGVEWSIRALPARSLGVPAALWLAIQPQNAQGARDPNYDVVYGNPYPGTELGAEISANAGRVITLPGSNPLTIYSGGTVWMPVEPTTSPTCDQIVLQYVIGIPGQPTLAGVKLDTDDKPVTIDPSQPVPLTWSLASGGPVDYSGVTLYEVVADGTNTTSVSSVRSVTTIEPSVVLDPSWLVPGHTYILGITNQVGFPAARNGDFATVQFSGYGNVLMWSSTFKVQ